MGEGGGRVSRRRALGTVILIRHARSVANVENILAGQTPGVRLDPHGIEQSKTLVRSLGQLPVAKVFVSPLERCMATIDPWLSTHGRSVAVQSDSRIIEPDYGSWSGRKLDELALEPLWRDVQSNPESVTFPNGERFVDVWDRVGSFYQSLRESIEQNQNYIIVSHGDIIKFLIARVLQMEFKNFQSLIVEPASVSIAQISTENARLIQYNRTHDLLADYFANLTKSPTNVAVAPQLGGEVRRNDKVQ